MPQNHSSFLVDYGSSIIASCILILQSLILWIWKELRKENRKLSEKLDDIQEDINGKDGLNSRLSRLEGSYYDHKK